MTNEVEWYMAIPRFAIFALVVVACWGMFRPRAGFFMLAVYIAMLLAIRS